MEKSYKCQTSEDSFIDSLFIVFNQSVLVTRIRQYIISTGITKPTVLEIGCYNGRLMKFLIQSMTFVNYIGVDVRNDYLEKSSIKNRNDVALICCDATLEIPIDDNSVDICVSSEVLEHINEEKWADLLRIIYTKLKIGGIFIVGFPNNTLTNKFHNPRDEVNLGHVNFPVHEPFVLLAKKCGFTLHKYYNSFSIHSNYRFDEKVKDNETYKKLKERLGGTVARAVFLSIGDEFNGGGYYIFKK